MNLMRLGTVRMKNGLGERCRRAAQACSDACRSSNEVMRDAKYCDAGQDQQRHCASYAAPQTIAREMTAHGLWSFWYVQSANCGRLPRFRTLSVPATDLNSA